MVPLGMSLATMQTRQRTGVFPPILVTQALSQALLGLALLHSADVIHTGEYTLTFFTTYYIKKRQTY